MNRISKVLVMAASAVMPLLVLSCARPASDESFVFFDEDGYANFTLDMKDSLDYSLQLYIYADASPEDTLAVQIDYMSPREVLYREDVTLTAADAASGGVLTRVLRSGFRPVNYGIWKASVRMTGEYENVNGAGLRLYRDKKDGSR